MDRLGMGFDSRGVRGPRIAGGPSDAAGEPEETPVLRWLLDGDASVRWQVEQDLLGEPAATVEAERARVATSGWGRALLRLQDPDGGWAGALYSPKWTSTTYTLLLLQRLGLPPGDPRAVAGTKLLWDSARPRGGGFNLAKTVHEPEVCITGMLVMLAASFRHGDPRLDDVVGWLLAQQLADGGWNCDSVRRGSRHGSFHTTITVLEALYAYGTALDTLGGHVPTAESATRGREFLLDHRLYRSHRTGEVVDPALTRFPFPPQWHYDIVRALEHFRAAGAQRDERLADAVDVVRRRRQDDGTWPRYRPYPGRQWFELEPAGPSRWSTLRALRVVSWWG